MPTYVCLVNWTEQGVKEVANAVDRYRQAQAAFEQMGVSFRAPYWTQGRYDIIGVLEAPDDKAIAAAMLKVASLGNIRTETLRAFDENEMSEIIEKMG
jgi:uncharacterized protein with GYD domain